MASGYYDITSKTLGKGHYGVVKLGRHCLTGQPVAIKIIEKSRLNSDSLDQLGTEIRILFRLSEYEHPNILKLYQTIDTEDKLYLVTEYCGQHACDLHDYLSKKHCRDGLSEIEAQIFFIQICSAISYCHSIGIVHRDLKPENILVTDFRHINSEFYSKHKSTNNSNINNNHHINSHNPYPILKLIDFGFANQWQPDEKMRTSCGTLAYSAPELLLGEPYDGTKVDVWGLGLMLYILLYGGNPFMQINDNETLTKILDCSFATPKRDNVDHNATELLRSLIKRDANARLPLDAILKHEWFSNMPKTFETMLNSYQLKSHDSTSAPTSSPTTATKSSINLEGGHSMYRPTSPDVGSSIALTDEENRLHTSVIQEMFRLTKFIDSKSSIEASLKNARFTHRQFNQSSIQPATINKKKLATGIAKLLGQKKGDSSCEIPPTDEKIDKLSMINTKLSNDDYIYATYQLTRDRMLRIEKEKIKAQDFERPATNSRLSAGSQSEVIPEEDSTGVVNKKGDDQVSTKENDGSRLVHQRKLLQPQRKMRDKFTSFFRSESTSPSGSFSISCDSSGDASFKDQVTHHEAFNDHNNEHSANFSPRYCAKKAETQESFLAYALPLARKCSLVSEESGCSNELPDNQS